MEIKPKQTLYKTALHNDLDKIVGIRKAVQTDAGTWVFQCTVQGDSRKMLHWFREDQLRDFVL